MADKKAPHRSEAQGCGMEGCPLSPGMSLNGHEPYAIEEFETANGPADYISRPHAADYALRELRNRFGWTWR